MKHLRTICALALVLALTISGCTFYSGDDLLLAPQPTKNYVALQEQLEKILNGGAIYAVPQSGENRSTVQLVDLDNDGEDEAVAFFRDSSTASTFTVYVFKKLEDAYVLMDSVEGHGLSVQSVEYPRLKPTGEKGIAIAWNLEDGQTSALTLCDFDAVGNVNLLMTTDYMNYKLCDMNGDGTDELFTISGDTAKGRTAALYTYRAGKITELGRATVSREAMSIVRLTAGYLEGGLPAVFTEERPDSGTGMMTDIYVYDNHQLRNITQNTEAGANSGSYRAMSVYVSDVDGDHITEVPQTVLMEGFGDPNEPDALYLLNWYSYAADGTATLKRTTYHNVAEEWIFQLPDNWRNRITATKESTGGVSRTTFSEYVEGGKNRELFSIYCCTGDLKNHYAAREDMTTLAETGNAIYAAKITGEPGASELLPGMEEIQSRFSLITADWTS